MTRFLRLALISVTTVSLPSCFFSEKEEKLTVVEGTVMNKYTGQPVGAAPIVVQRFEYRVFGDPKISPVTSALTNASGQYSLSFTASGKETYRVKVDGDTSFYDLTTYTEYQDYREGAKTQAGITNRLNFEVTPFKAVAVKMESSKDGKTDIGFDFESNDGKEYYGGRIFYDSVKANQRIFLAKTIKVLPNRRYLFTKLTCNRIRLGVYTYTFQDYAYVRQTVQIGYSDSVTIRFK